MERKKSEKADLENKRGIFFQIGLIVALAVVLIAFEYKSYNKQDVSDFGYRQPVTEMEEMTPITQQITPPPLPPPPAPTMVLNIVENTALVIGDIPIDAEADENTQVEVSPVKQEEEAEIQEKEIFQVVEDAPSFPGGDGERMRFLQQNIRYPLPARESGIQGIVYVTFVVERNGEVTEVKILRGIGGGCNEEALRVVRNMPRWEPGKQRGKPVRVQFNMPIKFAIGG